MAADQPNWRRHFDQLERAAAPRLEDLLGSEDFHHAIAAIAGVKRELRRTGEAVSRGLLHRLNLPAHSDVTRLLTEVGRLQVEVRRLGRELQRHGGEAGPHGDTDLDH